MFFEFLSKHPFLHRLCFINLVSSILSIIFFISIIFHSSYCYFFSLFSLFCFLSVSNYFCCFELCFAWFHRIFSPEIFQHSFCVSSFFSTQFQCPSLFIIISPMFPLFSTTRQYLFFYKFHYKFSISILLILFKCK